jgi:hypothetical protein
MLFTLLLRASLAVVVGIFSFVVKLMQVARLRFRHKTCGRKEQVYVPFTQSRNLLVVVWLGDMTFKLKRCYRTFEFIQCLHYCHETCRKEQVCAPSVQSQDLLVIRLARRHDFKIQKVLPHFRILKSRRLL